MQITFSHEAVINGLTGEALDQLLLLSDIQENRISKANTLSFVFEGWHHDERSVFEIPECRSFFRVLTQAWPFWFHFLEKNGKEIPMVLSLLCEIEKQPIEGGVKVIFTGSEDIKRIVTHLVEGLNLMHGQMQGGRTEYIAAVNQVQKELNCIIG